VARAHLRCAGRELRSGVCRGQSLGLVVAVVEFDCYVNWASIASRKERSTHLGSLEKPSSGSSLAFQTNLAQARHPPPPPPIGGGRTRGYLSLSGEGPPPGEPLPFLGPQPLVGLCPRSLAGGGAREFVLPPSSPSRRHGPSASRVVLTDFSWCCPQASGSYLGMRDAGALMSPAFLLHSEGRPRPALLTTGP
jgi:hypothetical protein